jgi:hypothetical protein
MKKICLSIFALLTCSTLFAQIPTGSLTGYWPFAGNANDLSGNSNNGTVTGATLTTDRFGNPNMAYSFDGVSNKITVNNAASIDMSNTTDFSIAFWLKTYTSPVAGGMPISKNTNGMNDSYEFFTNSTNPGYCNIPGQISFFTAPSPQGDACANFAVCSGTNLNTWFFITGVYDGTNNQSTIYVNGVLQSDVGLRTANLSSTNNLMFGCQPGNFLFYKGALDDIRIYKRKLNQSEINALYNECNPFPPVPAAPTNTTPASNQTLCATNSATLSATTASGSINWYSSPGSTVVIGTGTTLITPTLSAGTYTYYAEAATSCTVSANRSPVTVTVSVCSGLSTYSQTNLKLNLYPNPNDGNFAIETVENSALKIVNVYGQIILEETLLSGKGKIDISSYPRGIYFGEVKQNNVSKAFKFIIE